MTEPPPPPLSILSAAPPSVTETGGLSPLESVPPPGKVQASRTISGRFCLAGEGPVPCSLMVIGLTVCEDEVRTSMELGAARQIVVQPGVLRGAQGNIFRDLLGSFGLSREHYFYTPLVRYLLPKKERSKPKATDLHWNLPSLLNDIERVKPKVIMCMGKPVFDALSGVKLSQDEAQGGFFPCPHVPGVLLYPSYDLFKLITNPITYERVRVDVLQVMQELDEFKAIGMNQLEKVEQHYTTIHNATELRAVVQIMKGYKVFCVDCEWHGMQHIDGQLRSIQFSWRKGYGIYVRFMDDQLNYVFDVSYEEAGAILLEALGPEDVRYIGHHMAADFPWMHHWLKLPIDGRGFLDTEFALQTINEHADLSLERLAMAGTDLGRYDLELVMWKKLNKLPKGEGYGRIPDDVIIPYAIKDVDVPMRLLPNMVQQLVRKRLWTYYTEIFNPFVTDVFTDFAINGLPMDVEQMDRLRTLYSFARDELNKLFQSRMRKSAREKLLTWGGPEYEEMLKSALQGLEDGDATLFKDTVKQVGEAKDEAERADVLTTHVFDAQAFNIRSADHLRHWLFRVNGYTPVKTTGKPSIAWERVLNYPEHKRAEFTPSVDKQTLQLLGQTHSDADLYALLQLNAVGNVSKAFLKEPTLDEDGNVTKENGLHFWLASDNKIHGQFSATETGRPRSWKPNSLNWPSYVNKRISEGVANLFHELQQENRLPDQFRQYYSVKEDGTVKANVPSIRSCVTAPPGWCFVESDYATAEIRALGFISGDENLIRLMTEPDPQFGLVAAAGHGDDVPVRLFYAPDSGVLPANQSADFIFAFATKGKVVRRVTMDELLRHPDGRLRHPPHDLHWSLAEMTSGLPREMLNKDEQRAGAKVGNFSCVPEEAVIQGENGPVEIRKLLTCERVWDGVEWVSHEGIQYQGNRHTISYQGLRATPDHVVWLVDGRKLPLGAAAVLELDLARVQAGAPVEFRPSPGIDTNSPEGCVARRDLSELREATAEVVTQCVTGARTPLSVQPADEVRRHTCGDVGRALSSDAAEVSPDFARVGSQLPPAGHQGTVHVAPALCDLGVDDLAGRDLQREGLRQDRQSRALQSGEPQTNDPEGESTQYANLKGVATGEGGGVCKAASGGDIHVSDVVESVSTGLHGVEDLEEISRRRCAASEAEEGRGRDEACGGDLCAAPGAGLRTQADCKALGPWPDYGANPFSEAEIERLRVFYRQVDDHNLSGLSLRALLAPFDLRVEPVYDIINAGPRHRFVADGVLVSNSAYGASGGALERKIEADTGKKPPDGTGQALLDALARRQPVATRFLEAVAEVPKDPGFLVAASGRVRHFILPMQSHGVADRIYESAAAAQGREARNFLMQESVGATAARAAVWLRRHYNRHGMQAQVAAVLYDSILSLCPITERFEVAKCHQRYMVAENTWEYHGRTLTYPIDTKFVTSWSTSPSSEMHEKLNDPNWNVQPSNH